MKKIFSILFALALVISLGLATAAPVLAGTIIHVPGDYDTIQEAVDAALDGDTIMVAAGEYGAFQVIDRNNISIISTEGATVTTADLVLIEVESAVNVSVMALVEDSENINIEGIDFDGTEIEAADIAGIIYLESTGGIADLTVENIIGTEPGVGVYIVSALSAEVISDVEMTGSTISNNKIGILVAYSGLEAHFNNIVGNANCGVGNLWGGANVSATHNWWGDASGPYHESLNPEGGGDEVCDDVVFVPWLEAEVVAAKTETVTIYGTVDAKEEADTVVAVNGTATVTVARYDENPGGDAPTDFNALGKWIDVYVPDTTEVAGIEIRLYYTDAEVEAADVDEESLRLFWWDGNNWDECSDSGVNPASINGYSGYIWAKIRATGTTPTLAQLQGKEFGGYGHPSETNGGFCFIATAAYGTDTAGQLDILREFRDEVLLPNSLGAKLVSLYYKTSPPIAGFISQSEVLRTVVRVGFVDPIVKILTWTHHLWST